MDVNASCGLHGFGGPSRRRIFGGRGRFGDWLSGFFRAERQLVFNGEHSATHTATHSTHAPAHSTHAHATHATTHHTTTHHATHAHHHAHAGGDDEVADGLDFGDELAFGIFRRGDLKHFIADHVRQL
jgi:hypothetical protein